MLLVRVQHFGSRVEGGRGRAVVARKILIPVFGPAALVPCFGGSRVKKNSSPARRGQVTLKGERS